MKVYKELELEVDNTSKIIKFGQPDNQQEVEELYRLRYAVYSHRKFIDPSKYLNKQEIDKYDNDNKCEYFIAELDDKIIATVRLIKDTPLPSQLNFSFDEPEIISNISPENRGELSRLVIIPPDREKGIFLPRGLVMLFMISSLVDYGREHNLLGGYSFIKNSLLKKMKRIRYPIHLIDEYVQTVKKDHVLYKYFNQKDDPVVPMYFITDEFNSYLNKIMGNKWLFSQDGSRFVLNNNMYTRFLKRYNAL